MTTLAPAGADAAASAPVTPAGPSHDARPRRSAPAWAWLGLVPFAAYVVLFLAVPTVLAIGSGFFTKDGVFTWGNVSALGDPVVLTTFANSAGLSLLTAVVGAVVGALVCYALLGMNPEGATRSSVDAAAGVLAQFGGVMLAFAFIATIGIQGVVTLFLQDTFGFNIFADGTWLYELPGLILPYIYFQVPLMVITFMPALAALKPQWSEATLTLGGTRMSFWLRVGIPVLAPSFLASALLLFANAFSSYATAAALASQGAQIVPLQIRAALTSETVLGRENLAGALALGMIIVVAAVMALYSLVQRRAARWQS
ncbi:MULTISPECIES: ABC transporter permease subunit [unclassified Microbacterium]|uniref:ABC transporter permease n=1 Tax=unclassified Microbacterium TaxID=2609290 RepID=UPI000EA8D7BD|nr:MULTISPECIES: ABC transporter permease subunit [unclassified Microbacterium]MBT2484907.1 ABC transporter permease subunit [Microbacterium sp. ISL-108]RKN69539.1 ABC transporter permease subunit [Microbacterium sp. CGR2]